jgi:hypothetical protein
MPFLCYTRPKPVVLRCLRSGGGGGWGWPRHRQGVLPHSSGRRRPLGGGDRDWPAHRVHPNALALVSWTASGRMGRGIPEKSWAQRRKTDSAHQRCKAKCQGDHASCGGCLSRASRRERSTLEHVCFIYLVNKRDEEDERLPWCRRRWIFLAPVLAF